MEEYLRVYNKCALLSYLPGNKKVEVSYKGKLLNKDSNYSLDWHFGTIIFNKNIKDGEKVLISYKEDGLTRKKIYTK